MTVKSERLNNWLENPLLWSFLLLLYPLLNEVIFSDFVREGEYNSRIGWSLIVALLITLVDKRWFTALVLLPFAVGGTADVGYAYSFGGVFTTATMEAVANTDSYEVTEYIKTYSSWQQTALLTVLWSIYALAIYFVRAPAAGRLRKSIFVLGTILILVVAYRTTVMGKFHDTIPGVLGTLPSYYKGNISVQTEVALRKSLLEKTQVKATTRSADRQQTHIFIIGESATRNHMGMYGYSRNTTPELSAIQNELIVFNNVISSHVQTQASLRVALTAAAADQGAMYREALSIIDVANLAGYKSFWISNQQPQRATIASVSHQADVTHYISNDFNGVEVRRFDEYMLKSIAEAISDPAPLKVIFVHTMGSHAAYENRYPESFAKFDDSKVNGYREPLSEGEIDAINAYDNSILYTDYFVKEVISLLKAESSAVGAKEATLTYFSDHGEEVYQTARVKGHTPDNLTPAMMEIPFLVWTSDREGEQASILRDNSHKAFMLDDLFHYALGVMAIDCDILSREKSPAAAEYSPPKSRKIYKVVYEDAFQSEVELGSSEEKRSGETL
ncbi:MAG: hypothetical protein CSH37_13730 [Thalassolituus sp.]|uniref:phosphoethanolamine transferase n=1 Tax=Thalassolituus sp. TaxID=2030822 RepID=UPI0024374B1A|nr:phosphoethanolamine transferase [Thalassolituus sp.]TNC83542.1 MAG: hypothetical protein CSH37_13730 [Thalassolituus sp.]